MQLGTHIRANCALGLPTWTVINVVDASLTSEPLDALHHGENIECGKLSALLIYPKKPESS